MLKRDIERLVFDILLSISIYLSQVNGPSSLEAVPLEKSHTRLLYIGKEDVKLDPEGKIMGIVLRISGTVHQTSNFERIYPGEESGCRTQL